MGMGRCIICTGFGNVEAVVNEFDLIAKYFAPLSMVALDDDAAVLSVPDGCELVVSSDVLNEGVHFLENEPSRFVASKALRANLSDLAAMGAEPLCYQLGLALPQACGEEWVAEFAGALEEDQTEFSIRLSGGDTTTSLGGVSVSMSIMGLVPTGGAVRRRGARVGDLIVLSGAVGDAALGLRALRGEIGGDDYLVSRYRMPTPRLVLAKAMRAYVRAAADVSDGLLADLGHVAAASGVRGVVEVDRVVFSAQAQAFLDCGDVGYQDLLAGGDDYELVMAVAPADYDAFFAAAAAVGVAVQVIGCFEEGAGVEVLDERGDALLVEKTGWQHFS